MMAPLLLFVKDLRRPMRIYARNELARFWFVNRKPEAIKKFIIFLEETAMPATKTKDAIALLKEDHKKVKDLFDQFEKAKSDEKKHELIEEALKELEIHTVIEEEMFYPEAREALGEEAKDILDEAEEEHRVAKTLVEDLKANHQSDEHFEAKFIVLAENVRHHIKEEESEMFPEIRDSELDLEEIGQRLAARKEELKGDEDSLQEAEQNSKVKPYQELGVA